LRIIFWEWLDRDGSVVGNIGFGDRCRHLGSFLTAKVKVMNAPHRKGAEQTLPPLSAARTMQTTTAWKIGKTQVRPCVAHVVAVSDGCRMSWAAAA
jgi:hypothetical protein